MDYPAGSTARGPCERSHQDLLVGGTPGGKQFFLHASFRQCLHHEMDSAQRELKLVNLQTVEMCWWLLGPHLAATGLGSCVRGCVSESIEAAVCR